jgi:FkbM family methyltransferase
VDNSLLTKEEFSQKLNSMADNKKETLVDMRASSIPLVIYGTGNYAKSVYEFLKNRGINAAAACIDKEYYDDNWNSWNGVPVFSTEKLALSLKPFNIVIGFADFKKALQKLKGIEGLNNAYFLDSVTFYDILGAEYIKKNIEKFYDTYCLLDDQYSRDVLLAYLTAKITGVPDEYYDYVIPDQYFPKDIIKLNSDEVFVDAGAYTGDTILRFLKIAGGKYKAIYAFEPEDASYNAMADMAALEKLNNIFLFKKGVWKEKKSMCFKVDTESSVRSSLSNTGNVTLEVDAIDNIMNGTAVTYIKMDIEGAEFEALSGAEKTIKKAKPKLAICVYHKSDDLITIPQYLNSLAGYKLYLRPHLFITQELVLYAVAK